MIKIALVAFMSMLFVVPAMADSPAVGYWFIESGNLTNAVNRVGNLANVDQATLDELAEYHGHFKGTCNIWLHARTVQFRLKATDDGKTIDYSMSLSWPQVKRQPQSSEGRLDVGGNIVAKDGWEKDKFVLVLKRLNLKQ